MYDFSKINGFDEGQRSSFEELLCQLAHLEKFPEGSRFERIEGAGGDGGVEALWRKPSGKKTGYQAKYFLRAGEVDWAQIDKSVFQAIKTHPELEKYIVGIPCDLTGPRGRAESKGRKGKKSGWEHWDARVESWKDAARKEGIKEIEFELWGKSTLQKKLIGDKAVGLGEYFFGDVEFTTQWFRQHLDEAVESLDERYHPEDHVNVRIQSLFSFVSRDENIRQKLQSALKSLEKVFFSEEFESRFEKLKNQGLYDAINETFEELRQLDCEFSLSAYQEWQTEKWETRLEAFENALTALRRWYWDPAHRSGDAIEGKDFEHEIYSRISDIGKIEDVAGRLGDLFRSPYMKSEKQRFALVTGRAGAGKSHLLAQCASNAISEGNPAVLILGQRLSNEEIWSQIAKQLGLIGCSSDQILGALNSSAKRRGVRCLLLVDAINEGPGSRFWRNQLGAFLERISRFSFISCVVTCRSEYVELAIPEELIKKHTPFEIAGFETPEELLNAARVYLDKRGIARPSTPWLAPEFINPLFLRSVCVSLERDGKSEFPPGLTGTKKILLYYLESLGRNIQNLEGLPEQLAPRLGRAVREIAIEMLQARQDFLSLDDCRAAINKHFSAFQPRSESDWLSVFLHHGLLRRDPNPAAPTDVFAELDVIRFSFQRFQDFLMAEQAVEKRQCSELFGPTGWLSFCLNQKGTQIEWEWYGLIDALSVVVPEKFGEELVDVLPGGYAQWWRHWGIVQAFQESAKWRDRGAFSDRSLELLNALGHGLIRSQPNTN